MRTLLFTTIIVPVLLLATVQCQSANQQSTDQISTECRPHSERWSNLLARSDMQSPRAIPVIRPLRFQEIPASFDTPAAGRQKVSERNQPVVHDGIRQDETQIVLEPIASGVQ
jgi:hypothetical protein